MIVSNTTPLIAFARIGELDLLQKIVGHMPSLFLITVLTSLLSGCLTTFGPQAIERTHPAYNEAIIASINEQMLQNLVRMRYRDVTFFLEIGSVTTSLSLQASAGVDAALNFGTRDSLSPGVGLGYADNPTISYTPLQGRKPAQEPAQPAPARSHSRADPVRVEDRPSVRLVF